MKFHRRIIYSSFRKLRRRGEKNSSDLDVCLFEGIFSFTIANALYRRIKASYLECTDGHKQHSHCISLCARGTKMNLAECENRYRLLQRKIRLEIRLILKTWKNSVNKGSYVLIEYRNIFFYWILIHFWWDFERVKWKKIIEFLFKFKFLSWISYILL